MINVNLDIVVPTFNQEKYILKAISSILEQECDFEYRIIIGDDHSTDSTGRICEEFHSKYPDTIVLLRNESNLGLVRNYNNIFSRCNSKYIAILEGDDYWIDPLKLQKQFAILESDSSIGLVHTGSFTLFENGDIKRNHLNVPQSMLEGNIYESLLLKRNTISPMTVMFRKDIFDKYVDFDYFVENDFKTIDYPMWLAFSRHSQIAYINEPTAVYRSLKKSVSRPGNFEETKEFFKTSLKSKSYYFRKFPLAGVDEKEVLSPTYFILAELLIKSGNINQAKEYADKINNSGFMNRFLKLAVMYSPFYYLYRFHLNLKPLLSQTKQIVYKITHL